MRHAVLRIAARAEQERQIDEAGSKALIEAAAAAGGAVAARHRNVTVRCALQDASRGCPTATAKHQRRRMAVSSTAIPVNSMALTPTRCSCIVSDRRRPRAAGYVPRLERVSSVLQPTPHRRPLFRAACCNSPTSSLNWRACHLVQAACARAGLGPEAGGGVHRGWTPCFVFAQTRCFALPVAALMQATRSPQRHTLYIDAAPR